jgi:2-polyprenyl-6-methoxyphenol hydroxylase-like FAD-dependent oxidoreductase
VAEASEADVLIVGAGITGLSAAIALDRVGIKVEIVERASALTEAGTALSLWPNALAALRQIGLEHDIADIGMKESSGIGCRPSGKEIFKLDQTQLSQQLGLATQVVFRAELQRVLLDTAAHIPTRLHTQAVSITADGQAGIVELSTGERLRSEVVLACDGVHSTGRTYVGNPAPTYLNRTSWRAVLRGSTQLVPAARLTIGRGQQFIMSPLKGGLVYWAADVAMPEGANAALADKKAFLRAAFDGWHDPVCELIERTEEDQLVIADFYDSIPVHLAKGPVALLGDAAHPMSPDLGQGGCQGIEDAAVMAACLNGEPDRYVALAKYEGVRLHRVRTIVRDSHRIGRIATAKSPAVVTARDLAARCMPSWLNARLVARYASEDAFLRNLGRVAT